jgi:hypothetical protein
MSPHVKAISVLLFHQLLARILALLDENDNAISRSKPRQLVALFGPEEAKQCRGGVDALNARFISYGIGAIVLAR